MSGTEPRAARAYAMLACVMLFWSGNAIVGRAIRADIPPATLSLLRWSGAFVLLLPFAWHQLVADRAALIAAWRRVLLLGVLGVAAFNTLYYLGLHDTTASNGLLLQALIPAGILIADRAIFGIRPPGRALLGVGTATLGVGVIVFRGDPDMVTRMGLGRGDLLILAAIVLWSLYTSLLKTRPAVHALSFLVTTFGIAVIALAPLAALEFAKGARVAWSQTTLLAVGYVAIFPSLIAYLLFNQAVTMIGAGAAGQATNLMPLFGALLAAALLGEPLHRYHAAGMTLILIGLCVGLVRARRETVATD